MNGAERNTVDEPNHNVRASVLVADDEVLFLEIYRKVLTPLGIDLVAVSSGTEAISTGLKQEFAVILLDVSLGDMDGFAVAEKLRQGSINQHTPILFLTAHRTETPAIERGYSLGAVDYLFKPFRPIALQTKVNFFMDLFLKSKKLESLVATRTSDLSKSVAQLQLEVTERKQAEQALRESETKYRIVAQNTYDWEFWQDPDEKFIYLSPSCERITGHKASEFLNEPGLLMQIIHPEDREAYERHLGECRVLGPTVEEMEFRVVRPDGESRWIGHVCQGVYDWDGRYMGRRGSNRDITERKLGELQLQQALSEIRAMKEKFEVENIYLREEINTVVRHEIIGQSPSINKALAAVNQVGGTDSTVLILGETGCGKELMARAIHELSPRKTRPMVKVNCAALPGNLIESELFGREKGAFTGAHATMPGRFEVADGSSIFLDEIGELPLELQSKLLRVLQEGQFERVGSTHTFKVNVRVIAATNRDLTLAVREGRFREDLYFRLNVFPITVPPLRDRVEDIPLLVKAFVAEFSKRMGKKIQTIPRKTMELLLKYSWPGNIRELRNVVERAMIVTTGTTLEIEVPQLSGLTSTKPQAIQDLERDHFLTVLEKTGWRIRGPGGASEILNLKPTTLEARLKKHGLKRPFGVNSF
jgi:PAS domain S-box-containing protein